MACIYMHHFLTMETLTKIILKFVVNTAPADGLAPYMCTLYVQDQYLKDQ